MSDEKKNDGGLAGLGFTQFKRSDNDPYAVALCVGVQNGSVILAFNEMVNWLDMNADEARMLGKVLIDSANELDGPNEDGDDVGVN